MEHGISPADVGQFWHGLRRPTSGEIYQMRLKSDDLCAEQMGYPDSGRFGVQHISVHPSLIPVGG